MKKLLVVALVGTLVYQPPPTTVGVPTPTNLLAQASLVFVEGEPLCFTLMMCEWGPGPAPENARNLPEGYQPPPSPTPCGPSTCPSGDPEPEPDPDKPGNGPKPDHPGKGPKNKG